MHTTFTCSSCQRTIAAQVPPGSRVQCPLCQQVVIVPFADGGAPVPFAVDSAPPAPLPYEPYNPNQPIYGQPPAPGYRGHGVPVIPASSGLAVASMVCGILSILGICVWGLGAIVGLVALGLGIGAVVQIRRQPQRLSGKGMAIAGIVLGCLSLVLVPVLLYTVMIPGFKKIQTLASRGMCEMQLHSLGIALNEYAAKDSGHMYPDDISRLYAGGNFMSFQMTCPDDTTGGQSYFYVPGFGPASPRRQVIAYEHPDVHKSAGGGTVLYNDGSVIFETGTAYQNIISNLKTPDGKRFAPHEP